MIVTKVPRQAGMNVSEYERDPAYRSSTPETRPELNPRAQRHIDDETARRLGRLAVGDENVRDSQRNDKEQRAAREIGRFSVEQARVDPPNGRVPRPERHERSRSDEPSRGGQER